MLPHRSARFDDVTVPQQMIDDIRAVTFS